MEESTRAQQRSIEELTRAVNAMEESRKQTSK
jgi:hypothetical protein